MPTLVRFCQFLLLSLLCTTSVHAQLRTEDLFRLGVQILNEATKPPAAEPPLQSKPKRSSGNARQSRQAAPRDNAIIAEVQQRLNQMGYASGDVDGRMGPRTRQAIIDFQRDHGLPATGDADAYLVDFLRTAGRGGGGSAKPLVPRVAEGPSFDCNAARQQAEQVVCASRELAALDRALALAYSAATASGLANPGEQKAWLAQRNRCGSDRGCLALTYRTRLAQLGATDQLHAEPSAPDSGAGGFGQDYADLPLVDPTYADFVHMALMSDTDAYLADAASTGIIYLKATGTEEQCRELYQAENGNEFMRREVGAQAAALLRDVITSLPSRPRKLTLPIESSHDLAEYDFERQGFPFSSYSSSRFSILAAGVVPLRQKKAPVICGAAFGYEATAYPGAHLMNLGAEHPGVPEVDLLPMPPDKARHFRSSNSKILLKAMMVVEPRDRGRGPLKGRVVALTAHDEKTGELLHRWTVGGAAPAVPENLDQQPLTSDLLARLIGPIVEPRLRREEFDDAAINYFKMNKRGIDTGNPPPDAPLPLEAMRGRLPEVIASLNRDRLRAILHEDVPALPLTVTIEQTVAPSYDESVGLSIMPRELAQYGYGNKEITPESLDLSSRDLPLYDRVLFLQLERASAPGFREIAVASGRFRIAFELDRVLRIDPVPMDIEHAAARGLVGDYAGHQRDSAILRWELEINEVRGEDDMIVVSASLKHLSYRWASDGAPIIDYDVAVLPTVAGLRETIEAALPPRASADNVMMPPPGTPFGAEMADLLQLRYQPESVDDAFIERMMMSRFAYEASLPKDQMPMWGSFYRDFAVQPTPEQRKERLAEFRAWSEARAASLPDVLTLTLPLNSEGSQKIAPYQRGDKHPYANQCLSNGNGQGKQTEKDAAREQMCAFLDAAWRIPEPSLFLTIDHNLAVRAHAGPRSGCGGDRYCTSMYDVHSALKLPRYVVNDIVQVDRLPQVEAAMLVAGRSLVLQIEVQPTGASVAKEWPSVGWLNALAKAAEFDKVYGIGIVGTQRQYEQKDLVVTFQARAVAARVIDAETGAIIAEPELAAPAPLPLAILEMPESQVLDKDVLGVRLGMPFEEADRLIRAHMQVGKVLTADRSQQMESVSGEIVPYTSGRIYASAAGDEMIAIFDEPPAAPQTVLGVWRVLRLPKGETSPASLRAALAERYGEPSASQEVDLPFMQKGLAFFWLDNPHERCESIQFDFQTDLWRDENGDASWLIPFMTRPLFPILNHKTSFLGVNDAELPPANFCPTFLGVRYATYDGKNYEQPAGDEVITWLSDNRSYAKAFYESRKVPAAPVTENKANTKIKF